MTRLSIIIPVYCAEQYIARCLDSIFALNFPEDEYEVICVDDCTKDGSVRVIEEFQKDHTNIRLIHHEENRRQGGARNTGVSLAMGEFLIFVDADDRIPKYDVSGILDYMAVNQLDLLLGAAECYGKEGSVSRWGNAPSTESPIMIGPELFTNEYIHTIAFGVVWMGIYKTELVRRVGPFVEQMPYEDADWTLRCAYNAENVQYKPLVIYHYMDNPMSTTNKPTVDSLIYRTKQSLRVWSWAQTTSKNHVNVMLSAEDFCTWNLRCLKTLGLYGCTDRRSYYHSFSKEEFSIMKQWKMGGRWMDIVRKPILARFALAMASPFLRFGKTLIKKNN